MVISRAPPTRPHNGVATLLHRTPDVLTEKGTDSLGACGRERRNTIEGIGNAKAFVLRSTHGVVRQNLDLLHAGIASHMGGEGVQTAVVVGEHFGRATVTSRNGGHYDVANPRGDVVLFEVVEEALIVGARLAREALVKIVCAACCIIVFVIVIVRLDVEHNEVGVLEHAQHIIVPHGAAGIEAGVEALRLAETKELGEFASLHEGFAAGAGHAAALDERFVAQHLVEEFLRRPCSTARASGLGREFAIAENLPRVGIVAEKATQWAALEEHDEAYARAVHCAEGFEGMDVHD